jgi:putative hydrolase of the HAD superfamily
MTDRRDRALLLDLDGVLRRWPDDLAARAERAAGLPTGSIHAAAFAPDLLSRAITGAIDDATWRSEATLRIARRHPLWSATQALAAWSASPGVVDPDVRALVARARTQARVVLVSNATTRLDDDLRALGLSDELDGVVNSSAVGHAKPDPRIVRAALDLAAVPPTRALFVDDVAAHVVAAMALGTLGHVFVDAAGLAAALAAHGLAGPGPR